MGAGQSGHSNLAGHESSAVGGRGPGLPGTAGHDDRREPGRIGRDRYHASSRPGAPAGDVCAGSKHIGGATRNLIKTSNRSGDARNGTSADRQSVKPSRRLRRRRVFRGAAGPYPLLPRCPFPHRPPRRAKRPPEEQSDRLEEQSDRPKSKATARRPRRPYRRAMVKLWLGRSGRRPANPDGPVNWSW
jgi:hypothetical protein